VVEFGARIRAEAAPPELLYFCVRPQDGEEKRGWASKTGEEHGASQPRLTDRYTLLLIMHEVLATRVLLVLRQVDLLGRMLSRPPVAY
jgi:hypothetical protein